MALTSERITMAALAILDDYGLADLTMRRLAESLDVKAGALYWHFPNKQALLAGLADQLLADLEPPTPDAGLEEWLAAWAHRLRRQLLAHRDAAELVASVRAMDLGQRDPAAPVRARLAAAGHPSDDADATAQAFLHFVLGHVVEEQTQSQLVALGVLPRFDADRSERQFRHGVTLLVTGTSTATP